VVGAEIPASTFPATPPVATSGRLVRPTFAVGEGWRWLDRRVLDTSTGVALVPDTAADGQVRWLPHRDHWGSRYGSGLELFADAGCTVPLAHPPTGGACEATTWYVAESGPIACSAPFEYAIRIFEHGPRHTGPTWELRSFSATCSPSSSTASVYEIGAEIPAATFTAVVSERR
jgi:hypothetical protein